MSIEEDVADIVLAKLADRHKLVVNGNKDRHREHRHKGYFIWQRALYLQAQHPDWTTAAMRDQFVDRLDSEYLALKAHLDTQTGTDRISGPLFTRSPKHLDLADLARRRASDVAGSKAVKQVETRYRRERARRVSAIAWRAGATYPKLWNGADDAPTADLTGHVNDLNEILDRRLRSVEWMNYCVAKAEELLGLKLGQSMKKSHWQLTDPNGTHRPFGPWKDGLRVRFVEYPRVPRYFSETIESSRIADDHADAIIDGKPWFKLGATRLAWAQFPVNHGRTGGLTWRLPADIRSHWAPHANLEYRIDLEPEAPVDAAHVLDLMFNYADVKKQDYWERSWLWCDLLIAALHEESLLFALRRRFADGAARFNTLVAMTNPSDNNRPYVGIAPVVGTDAPINRGYLMEEGPFGRHFENTTNQAGKMQVGDHVLFWNSHVYEQISGGDWRLENTLILDLDSTPRGLRLEHTEMQGHGIYKRTHAAYRRQVANNFQEEVVQLVREVRRFQAAHPTRKDMNFLRAQLIRWAPYEEMAAWFIVIPFGVFGNVTKTLAAYPGSFTLPANRHASFKFPDPPYANVFNTNVLYPIFEPRLKRSKQDETLKRTPWQIYFERRAVTGPASSAPVLDVIKVDGRVAPGLYYYGTEQDFGTVRPFTQVP